jgi:ribonuclease HI
MALEESLARKAREVQIYTDSQLLARQWEGRYKVRDPKLKELYEKARRLARGLQSCQVTHIPREKNKEADALANQAIDDYRQAGNPFNIANSP